MPRKKRSDEQLQALELAPPKVFEAVMRKVLKVSKQESDRQMADHQAARPNGEIKSDT